jgi:hypothetical protein
MQMLNFCPTMIGIHIRIHIRIRIRIRIRIDIDIDIDIQLMGRISEMNGFHSQFFGQSSPDN